MPTNVIGLWKGSIATIPAGAYLCDGNNSTPNLTDFFVVGAGLAYSVNATGGAASKTIPVHAHTIASHSHSGAPTLGASNPSSVAGIGSGSSGFDWRIADAGHSHSAGWPGGSAVTSVSASSGNNSNGARVLDNRPAFYTAAFIMFDGDALPSGSICYTAGSVPSGWALCNGSGGTPELRDIFPVATGTTYALGATGGATASGLAAHSHTAAHTHAFGGSTSAQSDVDNYRQGAGGGVAPRAHNHLYTGNTGSNGATAADGSSSVENRPTYKALYPIMKL